MTQKSNDQKPKALFDRQRVFLACFGWFIGDLVE
jgi:hypothetical protein